MLSAAIIVGQPNPLVAGVHHRMPVMLPDDYDRWLSATPNIVGLQGTARPYEKTRMKGVPVRRLVNSVKNETEECIKGSKIRPR